MKQILWSNYSTVELAARIEGVLCMRYDKFMLSSFLNNIHMYGSRNQAPSTKHVKG